MSSVIESGSDLPLGRLQGAAELANAIRLATAQAGRQGWVEWWWSDPDFADWPLGERAVVEALNGWAKSGRRLRLLATDYRAMPRLHPRFVTWRVTWDHLIEARAWAGAAGQGVPSACLTPVWTCERIDAERGVLLCSDQVGARSRLKLALQEAWTQATPAFPASTLGL